MRLAEEYADTVSSSHSLRSVLMRWLAEEHTDRQAAMRLAEEYAPTCDNLRCQLRLAEECAGTSNKLTASTAAR